MRITQYLKMFLLGVCLLPWMLAADELALNEDAPKSYIVQKGDTLWDISGIFLKQPWLWPKLWRLNPEVSNPHLIYPGEELRLVFDEKGEPMLVKGKPELKWSPQVRKQLKDQNPITTLPLHIIAPYIKYDSIATEAELATMPYVLGNEHGYKSVGEGIKLYVKGELEVGRSYAIYQKGEEIIDPETDEFLGFHLILVGTARGLRTGSEDNNEPGTLYLSNAQREVHGGDYVLPINEEQLLPAVFMMQAVSTDINGVIIKSLNELREFGKFDVVMINRGLAHDIKAGDVLLAKRPSPGVVETADGPVNYEDASLWSRLTSSEKGSDFKMPLEDIGTMMVFRTYENVSLALILRSTQSLQLQDKISAP